MPSWDRGQISVLEAYLLGKVYQFVGGIIDWIRAKFAVTCTRSGVVAFLPPMGFAYKRPKVMPANMDVRAQKEFVSQYRGLVENLGQDDGIYFMNGVRPCHNSVASHGWFKKDKVAHLPANSGRKRMNINGAINLVTRQVLAIEVDSIDAQAVVPHLKEMPQERTKGKIYIMVDNAHYYRFNVVRVFLREYPRIIFKFLPPYCPNLNIIERLWLIMKREVVFNRYHEKFDAFKEGILQFFKDEKWKKPCYEKMLTDTFQIIEPDFPGIDLGWVY